MTTLSRFTSEAPSSRAGGCRPIGEVPEVEAVVDALDQQVGEAAVAHLPDLIRAVEAPLVRCPARAGTP
jgi:hypothetical protein